MKAMIHYEQRTRDGHDYTCSTQPEKWGRHTGHDCNTCKKVDVQLKGGRPPKRTKGRGRPKSQEEIEYVASTALTEHMDVSSPPEQDVDPPPEQDVDPPPEQDVDPPPEQDVDPPPEQDVDPPPEQDVDPPPEQDVDPPPEQDVDPPPEQDVDPPPEQDVDPPPEQDVDPPPEQDVDPPQQQDVDPPPEQEVDPSQRALSTPSAISLRSVLNAPVDKTPTMIEQRAATHIIRRMINSGCERATDQDLRLPTGGPVRKYSIHIQFMTQQF